jgi:hypothetical protein
MCLHPRSVDRFVSKQIHDKGSWSDCNGLTDLAQQQEDRELPPSTSTLRDAGASHDGHEGPGLRAEPAERVPATSTLMNLPRV